MTAYVRDELLPGAYTAYGYRTAHVLRTSGRSLPAEGSGDRHLRFDRELIGRECDRLDRDNGVYEALLNRAMEAILGRSGFTLRMETPEEGLNDEIEAAHREWGRKPEVRGIADWQACEELALRAYFNRGDIGIALTDLEQVQYIEAPRITGGRRSVEASRNGGKIDSGVELDALDRPLAYWVAPYDRFGSVQASKARRIRAEDFILYAHRKKFSQTRGVPILTTVLPLVHRLNDILDSEAIAWQQLARFAVAVNVEGGAAAGRAMSSARTDTIADQVADLAERVVDIEQGTVFVGKPGEQVAPIKRDLPGQNFPESVRMFLRLIGMPFGLPLSVLLLDYSGSNYTSSRAELEQAYRMFLRRQRDLARGHHDPITQRWLEWRIAAGDFPAAEPGFYRWSWIAPEFPWIDQLKEAQAWGMRLDRGLATQRIALQSAGMDLEAYHDQREEEIREARRRAKKLSDEDPDQPPVPWQVFAGYPASVNAAAQPTLAQKKDPAASRAQAPEGGDEPEEERDAA